MRFLSRFDTERTLFIATLAIIAAVLVMLQIGGK